MTLLGLVFLAGLTIGCGSKAAGSTDSGTDGHVGSGADSGADGSTCSACAQSAAALSVCPADVATAANCPSPGHACCAGTSEWHCGNCAAETCHWFQACTPAGFDAGGGCNDIVSCPSDQTCISGGTCAPNCTPDAGVPCASGTTCTRATFYFNAVLVDVCL